MPLAFWDSLATVHGRCERRLDRRSLEGFGVNSAIEKWNEKIKIVFIENERYDSKCILYQKGIDT